MPSYSDMIEERSKREQDSFQLDQCLDSIFEQFDLDHPATNTDNTTAQILCRMHAVYGYTNLQHQSTFITALLKKYSWENIIAAFFNPRNTELKNTIR